MYGKFGRESIRASLSGLPPIGVLHWIRLLPIIRALESQHNINAMDKSRGKNPRQDFCVAPFIVAFLTMLKEEVSNAIGEPNLYRSIHSGLPSTDL